MALVTKPGTLLMCCEPFVYVGKLGIGTPTAPINICDNCLKIDVGFQSQQQRCAGCHHVRYCNKQCQKRGWKTGHKFECEGMKKLGEDGINFTGNKPRLLIRVLAKLQDGKDYFDEIETENGKVKRRFMDLVSHVEEIRRDDKRKDAVESCIETTKFLLIHSSHNHKIKLPDENELFEICGRIEINSFSIIIDTIIGAGLYLGGSIFNHSCDPLAVQIFDGKKLQIRAIKEIPKGLPLNQVTVCYGNSLQPSRNRKEHFLKEYFFECECEKCLTGLHDKEMRGIICYKKGCGAEIDSEELGSPCHSCGHKLKDNEVEKIRETEKLVNMELDSGDPEVFVEEMKQLNFSDGHWLMLKQSHRAQSSQLLLSHVKVYEYGRLHLKGLRRYVNPNDPDYGFVLKLMAQFALMMNKLDEAEEHLKGSKAILKIMYGEDSEYYKKQISDLERAVEHAKMMKMMRRGLNLG